jgi:ARG and Rhodanese-Phosphatase-superfamily-associated Protein domain
VRITEVDDEGSVPDLRVANVQDLPLLLLDGEQLVGLGSAEGIGEQLADVRPTGAILYRWTTPVPDLSSHSGWSRPRM